MQHETKQKLSEMLTRTGHVLDVADFDDIGELDKLAGKVADPASGIDSPLRGHPVFFRGVPVYPLTLAHLTFLDECPALLAITEAEQTLCMLWVATIPTITDELYDPDKSRKTLKKWARKCKWTEQDIDAIIELRYGRLVTTPKEDGQDESETDSALIGMLSREYDGDPKYWMYEAPIGVIEACVADWNRQQEAQASAHRKAAGGKGPAVAPAASYKFVATRHFRECAERIEDKWQRKNP